MTAAAGTALERHCAVRTKRGVLCRRPAGWGTPHLGRGPCKLHGGCLPDVVRKYAREDARETALAWGIEADVDPFTAILGCVRMSYGAIGAFRSRIPDGAGPDSPEVIAYQAAQKQAAQIAKMAIDAGIAEREIRLAERLQDTIVAAFEDALADAELPDGQRKLLAEAFGRRLTAAEGDVIEGTAT